MAKDFLDKLGRTLKEGARLVARESEEVARIAKIRLDIAGLSGKRDDVWQEIGQKIYAQYEQGQEVPAEVADLCRRAQEIVEKIKAKEAELAALRAQPAAPAGEAPPAAAETQGEARYCPQCGHPVALADRYCSHCGNRLG